LFLPSDVHSQHIALTPHKNGLLSIALKNPQGIGVGVVVQWYASFNLVLLCGAGVEREEF
jgi:hypothetical protein